MSISVEHNLNDITRKFSASRLKSANKRATGRALARMQPYVPMETGSLRGLGAVVDHETIKWAGLPYGKAQFYGTNGIVVFRNYTTPGTGKRWDLKLKANHMTEVTDAYVRGLDL